MIMRRVKDGCPAGGKSDQEVWLQTVASLTPVAFFISNKAKLCASVTASAFLGYDGSKGTGG